MKKTTLYAFGIVFVLIPLTLFLGTKMSGKGYYLTSTLIIIETMLPFFLRSKAASRRQENWSVLL